MNKLYNICATKAFKSMEDARQVNLEVLPICDFVSYLKGLEQKGYKCIQATLEKNASKDFCYSKFYPINWNRFLTVIDIDW